MAPSQAITVGMRMRPLVGHEKGQLPVFEIANNQITIIKENLDDDDKDEAEGEGPFAFDVVMDSSKPGDPVNVDNDKCYELMGRPLVETVLEGYNACLFCYGQTGTGKTATIMGYPDLGAGLLPRMLGDMVEEANKMKSQGCKVSMVVQMLEVYNEDIHDLLTERNEWDKQRIRTRVLPKGVFITGASERKVETLDECLKIVDEGSERKTVAATKMNPTSSRGHTVFKLVLDKSGGPDATKLHSEVYFADLAGHENIKTTEVKGQRLTELTHINSSLMYLQRAISDLAKNSGKRSMAPFRNSELTLLLANGIVGNSKSTVIVTLSPAARHFDTSFSSIEFGLEVKGIKMEVTNNVQVDPKAMVAKLQAEVKDLKMKLEQASKVQAPAPAPTPAPIPMPVTDPRDAERIAKVTAENAKLLKDLSAARQKMQEQAKKQEELIALNEEIKAKGTEHEERVAALKAESENLLTEVHELRTQLAKSKEKKKVRKSANLQVPGEDASGTVEKSGDEGDTPAAEAPAAEEESRNGKKKKKRHHDGGLLEAEMREVYITELLEYLDSVGKDYDGADKSGDGTLGPRQLRPFANLNGFKGDDSDWHQEYRSLCARYGSDADTGMTIEAFRKLVNDENGKGYCTDRELLGAVMVLKRMDAEQAQRVGMLSNRTTIGFAIEQKQQPTEATVVNKTKTVGFKLDGPTEASQIEELNNMNMELASTIERLQRELDDCRTELKSRPKASGGGGIFGCCKRKAEPKQDQKPLKDDLEAQAVVI